MSAQLWPTPKVATGDYQNGQNGETFLNLSGAAKQHIELWPTPVAEPANGTPEMFLQRKRNAVAKGSKMGICLSDIQMVSIAHSSSPPASRVSRPVPPASAKEAAMTAGSGRKLSAWLPGSDPAGACLKTLLASPAWRSPLRSLTWTLKGYAGCPDEPSLKSSGDLTFWDMTSPATGMASLGFRVCRLSVSELSTDATGSGSSPGAEMWLTPNCPREKDADHCISAEYATQNQATIYRQAQSHAELWSTPDTCAGGTGPSQESRNHPRLQDQVIIWSTPTCRDHKGQTRTKARKEGFNQCLPNDVNCQTGPEPSLNAEPTASRGQLNPDFVCWLMGYPAGWLNYADSATPSSPKSRRKSSPPSVTPI